AGAGNDTAGTRPAVCGTTADAALQRGVLQLLQRAHLELDGRRLGREPALFLGERIDALALRLRRHRNGRDPPQTRPRERASALLADRVRTGLLERGEHGANVLRRDAAVFGKVCDEARLAERLGDRLRRTLLAGSRLLGCSHVFVSP